MAIQNRRGQYADFDPSKAVAGELLTVLNGDPKAKDGKAVYMAFASGDVKRLATYEDMLDNIENASEEIAEQITEEVEAEVADSVQAAQTAATTATTKASEAAASAASVSASASQIATNTSDISDLKSALDANGTLIINRVQGEYTSTPITYVSYAQGKYVKADGTRGDDFNFKMFEYVVDKDKAYQVTSIQTDNAVFCTFINSGGTMVDYVLLPSNGYQTATVTVPVGASRIRINTRKVETEPNTYAFADSMYGVNEITGLKTVNVLKDGIQKETIVPSQLANMKDFLLSHGKISADLLPSDTIADSYFVKGGTGTEAPETLVSVSYSGVKQLIFDIEPLKTYRVRSANFYGAKPWAILDDKGRCIDVSASITANFIMTDEIVYAPKFADKLYVNVYETNQTEYKVNEITGITSYTQKHNERKWGIIGDSLTQKIGNNTDYADKFYWEYVSERFGLDANCVAVRGTGFKKGYDYNIDFTKQIALLDSDCDFITVFGSGNDMSYAVSSGTPSYGSITDTFTTYADSSVMACMKHFFETIRSTYPLLKVMCFAPTEWRDYGAGKSRSAYMTNYVSALKEVCDYYNVPFIDTLHDSGFIPSVSAFESAYTVDGTHPNTAGQKFITPIFYKAVRDMLGL